jgi:hypothetical protein
MIATLALLTCAFLQGDEVIHPHTSIKEAIEFLKNDKFEEFVKANFQQELLQREGQSGIEKIVKTKKDKLIPRFENAVAGKLEFGTYEGRKIALLRFKEAEGKKLGLLLYLDGDRYKFGIEETVDEEQIAAMKLDAE